MAPIWKGVPIPSGPTLLLFLLFTCLIVGYSAWTWRISLAEREAEGSDPGSVARTGQAG
jgi:hypothetical protein